MADLCLAYLTRSKIFSPDYPLTPRVSLLTEDTFKGDLFALIAALLWPRLLKNINGTTTNMRNSLRIMFDSESPGLQCLVSLAERYPISDRRPPFIYPLPIIATPFHYALWAGIDWLVLYVLIRTTSFSLSDLLVSDNGTLNVGQCYPKRLLAEHTAFLNHLMNNPSCEKQAGDVHGATEKCNDRRRQDAAVGILKPPWEQHSWAGRLHAVDARETIMCRLDASLMWAVYYRHHQLVTTLIAFGADVNKTNVAFNQSIEKMRCEPVGRVKKLLRSYIKTFRRRGKQNRTALHPAFEVCIRQILHFRDHEVVQDLLDTTQVTLLIRYMGSPLSAAVLPPASREITRTLLNAGALVNVQSLEYGSALQAALMSRTEGRFEIVQMLLDAGADVNARGGRYRPPLHLAAFGPNNNAIVRLLLNKGADVNAGGFSGTPLEAAIDDEDNFEVIKLLMQAGADINTKSQSPCKTALVAAVCKSSNIAVIKSLLDAGADVNEGDGYYGSPLYAASKHCDKIEVAKVLLNAGADVNAEGGVYGTALQAATAYLAKDSPELVSLLLAAGANVNATGGHYHTALQAACVSSSRIHRNFKETIPPDKNVQIVKMLLKAGADVKIRGGKYGSALDAAMKFGNAEIRKLLRDAGANADEEPETLASETELLQECITALQRMEHTGSAIE